MSLLKEITNTLHADQELTESYEAYLAELEAAHTEKKFSILTEIDIGQPGQPSPDRSEARMMRGDRGAAQDLATGAEEERRSRAQQQKPFVIVRKKDGTYTGQMADKIEWNAAGTKSAKFAGKEGDIWFDPESKREATPQEKEQMAQRNPKLAASNFPVYDQMT